MIGRRRQSQIPGIGQVGKTVKLHTDFKFTEGPAADAKGNVYFTDIPDEKIYKVDAEGKLSVFTRQIESRQRPDVQRQGRTRRLRDGRPDRRL